MTVRDRYTITVCSECGALLADDRDYGLGPDKNDECARQDGQRCGQLVNGSTGEFHEVPGWEDVLVAPVREA